MGYPLTSPCMICTKTPIPELFQKEAKSPTWKTISQQMHLTNMEPTSEMHAIPFFLIDNN